LNKQQIVGLLFILIGAVEYVSNDPKAYAFIAIIAGLLLLTVTVKAKVRAKASVK
jgi:hypothetical protein